MKEFFDRVDIFLEKRDPLFCFIGVVVVGALICHKLECGRLKTGRFGAVKAVYLIVYVVGSAVAGVVVFAPWINLPDWIGGIIGFFAATVAAAWAETKADTPHTMEYQKKLNAEILKKFGINMN